MSLQFSTAAGNGSAAAITVQEHVRQLTDDRRTITLIERLSEEISSATAILDDYSPTAQRNLSGDLALKADLRLNERFHNCLAETGFVRWAVSEEDREVRYSKPTHPSTWGVAFDPLDGSKNLHLGGMVGMIFGFFDAPCPLGKHGHRLNAALCASVGSSTHLAYAIRGHGTHVFRLGRDGLFRASQQPSGLRLPQNAHQERIAMIGGKWSDYPAEQHQYLDLEGFKRRWTGCLAAECTQALSGAEVVFAYRGLKLRLLYEILPVSLLIREAYGETLCGDSLNGSLMCPDDAVAYGLAEKRSFYFGTQGLLQAFIQAGGVRDRMDFVA